MFYSILFFFGGEKTHRIENETKEKVSVFVVEEGFSKFFYSALSIFGFWKFVDIFSLVFKAKSKMKRAYSLDNA